MSHLRETSTVLNPDLSTTTKTKNQLGYETDSADNKSNSTTNKAVDTVKE